MLDLADRLPWLAFHADRAERNGEHANRVEPIEEDLHLALEHDALQQILETTRWLQDRRRQDYIERRTRP